MKYHHGTGVPQDHAEAVQFLTLASDQGHQSALNVIAQLTAQYPAGTRVRITALDAAAHLNGRLGAAVQPPAPLAAG